jgi:ubiquinone/menaquinone biosynthesis C-methylase UbiE
MHTLQNPKGPTIMPKLPSQDSTDQAKLQQIQHQFGAAAASYVTSKVHAQGKDLQWLTSTITFTGTERVLDVATGSGHTAFALAPHVAEVVALDLTNTMLAVAQQEATTRNIPNISFLLGDAQAIPLADKSFDILTCRLAAHHFPNVQQASAEFARMLKPGGTLLVIDSCSPEEPAIDLFLNTIETLRDPSHVRNYRSSEWKDYLNAAGFTINSIHEEGVFLDITDWTQRMRTPIAAVALIKEHLRQAPSATRERLRITEHGFTLPIVLLTATLT